MGLSIKLDAAETTTIVTRFIRDVVEAAGARGVVLGLSGGIDSAVVGCLAARALGPERVHAVFLPSGSTSDRDRDDARSAADTAGFPLHEVDVDTVVTAALDAIATRTTSTNTQSTLKGRANDSGEQTTPTVADTASDDGGRARAVRANVTARARMTILYAIAQSCDMLVIGTGNKSEALVGYFTKHGDGGVDLQPIGDLYKTQVLELARHLGLPEPLVEKPPSAGLWEGQSDEEELGAEYGVLDRILLGLEVGLPTGRIAGTVGIDEATVERFEALRRRTQHKRRMPLTAKLGIRTNSTDWRDPVMGAARASHAGGTPTTRPAEQDR